MLKMKATITQNDSAILEELKLILAIFLFNILKI